MKTKTQKAGRTPQSPRSNTSTLTVDLSPDSLLLELPAKDRDATVNAALLEFLTAKKRALDFLERPAFTVGGVVIVNVPLTQELAKQCTALAGAHGLPLGVVVGSYAKTWIGSTEGNDAAVEELAAAREARCYYQQLMKA